MTNKQIRHTLSLGILLIFSNCNIDKDEIKQTSRPYFGEIEEAGDEFVEMQIEESERNH